MARWADKLIQGDLWQRNCADIISSLAELLGVAAAAPTAPTNTYTPTVTDVANISSSAAGQWQYMRVGNTVTMSGPVSLDAVAGATLTQLGISLPIASNFGAAEDCSGVAFCPAVAGMGAAILADATNNRAQLEFISSDTNAQTMYCTATYQII